MRVYQCCRDTSQNWTDPEYLQNTYIVTVWYCQVFSSISVWFENILLYSTYPMIVPLISNYSGTECPGRIHAGTCVIKCSQMAKRYSQTDSQRANGLILVTILVAHSKHDKYQNESQHEFHTESLYWRHFALDVCQPHCVLHFIRSQCLTWHKIFINTIIKTYDFS